MLHNHDKNDFGFILIGDALNILLISLRHYTGTTFASAAAYYFRCRVQPWCSGGSSYMRGGAGCPPHPSADNLAPPGTKFQTKHKSLS